jgi:hypothetical protein
VTPRGRGYDDDRASRAAFRAFVRANHPDVGGDPDVFARGLAEFGRSRGDADRERSGEDSASAPLDQTRFDGPVTFVAGRGGVTGAVGKVRQWRRRRRCPPRVQ